MLISLFFENIFKSFLKCKHLFDIVELHKTGLQSQLFVEMLCYVNAIIRGLNRSKRIENDAAQMNFS